MSKLIDTHISKCKNWDEFVSFTNNQTDNSFKGALFERLTQVFLLNCTPYASKLKHVWWCNNKGEFPDKVRKKLNLPKTDEGIDLVCETEQGEFWSVQCKYKANQDKPLTHKELSTFESLSFNTSRGISLALVVHTSTKPVRKAALMRNVTEIGLDKWLQISDEDWKRIRSYCRTNKLEVPKKRKPRKHQKAAIKDAVKHYSKRSVTRGKLIMPCGTGKSLTAFWIAQALNPKTIIVSVPSLALIRQSLADWTAEYLSHGVKPDWIAVCSDETVGKTGDADSTVATVYETGIPTTTDIESIKNFLKKRSSGPKIIFTTYQSAQRLCDAAKEANKQFDLLICDEAHKTVGSSSKSFSTLLFDENIKVKKRIFMTATERVYKQTSSGKDDVVSMDNPDIYGDVFHQLTFKEAIKQKIICDYKIITIAVTEKEAAALIADNPELRVTSGKDSFETDAHNLSVGLTLQKVFEKHGIKHAVTFHSSIKRATFFTEQQQVLLGEKGISNHHISSKQSAGERASLLRNFANDNKAIISNARCLTEGVDIPSIDCVVFADPKKSTVDIVQAAGRAMRQSKATGKEYGYILLPLVIPDNDDLSDFAEDTNFKDIARVITSLSTQDERIAEQMRARAERKSSVPSDIVQIETDVFDLVSIKSEDLGEVINTRVWSSVGKANWRPFESARAFVRNLNLKSQAEWNNFCSNGDKPNDIPRNPDRVYAKAGWISLGDWLGTGKVATRFVKYRTFKEARSFIHLLNLKNRADYHEYLKSSSAPNDIPATPWRIYKDNGWVSMGDFLGTDIIASQKMIYRKYEDARKFAISLGLSTQTDWRNFKKHNELPNDIPANPNQTYKNDGWINWGHWLGTGFVHPKDRVYLTYLDAQKKVSELGLKTWKDWLEYCKSGKLSNDIPASPDRVYKNSGWVSVGDWLGTGNVSDWHQNWRSFEDARKYAHSLKLTSYEEWKRLDKSDLPADIPKDPRSVYRNDGWVSSFDFLGIEKKYPHPPNTSS